MGDPQNGCFIMENPIEMDDVWIQGYHGILISGQWSSGVGQGCCQGRTD